MPRSRFSSFESFHRLVPQLVPRLTEHPELAVRAMANPLLALEELGIELSPDVAREVERRARFGSEQRARLGELERRLEALTGERVDPESASEVERLLFTRRGLRRPEGMGALDLPLAGAPGAVPPAIRFVEKAAGGKVGARRVARLAAPEPWVDPLTRVEGDAEVVRLLVAHRAICARVPRLATREEYELLRARGKAVPVSRVVVRMPQHREDRHG